jgi:hypothetical protein
MDESWIAYLSRGAEHVSTWTAAAAGGSTGGLAIFFAWLDPANMELWLRLLTLGMGFLTTFASAGLIALKYYDRWRAREDRWRGPDY